MSVDFRPEPRSPVASVLLVEDDPDHRDLATMRLTDHGLHVVHVETLGAALDLLRVGKLAVDAIVLDLGLPDEREHTLDVVRSASDAPIVVHSATPAGDRRLPAGVTYLDKVSGAKLAEMVEDAVQRCRRITELTGRRCRDLTSSTGAADFPTTAQDVVDDLARWSGVDTWMVTRVVGDDWTILSVHDEHYGLAPGQVLRWSDSYCSRMVAESRPNVVADTGSANPYADAPIGQRIPIGCYVGIPLHTATDGLFGTLCGIQPHPHTDERSIAAHEPALHLVARTLSSVIAHDLERSRLHRQLDTTERIARIDPLTGLANRRAWNSTLVAEQARCDRFGHPATVAIVDLDGLKAINDLEGHDRGDALLRRAGEVLGAHARVMDAAFRIGGDEFALLFPETGSDAAPTLRDRLHGVLADAGIDASIGVASIPETLDLDSAVRLADERMYADKQRRATTVR